MLNIGRGKGNEMKKPIDKKIISYVKNVLIESTFSEYNEVLEVYLVNGRYQLCTEGAVYSYEDKYINFTRTFERIDWNKLKVNKVLVLGLGLASVPQMLEQKFDKKFEYHAVEIDSEIIRLADNYILDELESPIQIFEMDAEIFVDVATEKYDMIIVDIFEDASIPPQFETKSFLEKTKNLLRPDGLLLFNRLNISDETLEDTLNYYKNIFKPIFPFSKDIYIKDNVILCNDKRFIVEGK